MTHDDTPDGLVAAAMRFWKAQPPQLAISTCEANLAAAERQLEEAHRWDRKAWQALRNEAHTQALTRAAETEAQFKPDRDRVSAQIAEATRLHDLSTDPDTQATLKALIDWLQKQLDGELAHASAPVKKVRLQDFIQDYLEELGREVQHWQYTLRTTREAWQKFHADQERIRRVATAIDAASSTS